LEEGRRTVGGPREKKELSTEEKRIDRGLRVGEGPEEEGGDLKPVRNQEKKSRGV